MDWIKFFLIGSLLFALVLTWIVINWQKKSDFNWIVYYGDEISLSQLKDVQLAILEPGNISPQKYPSSKTLWVGYVSLGEVSKDRPYWEQIKEKDYVIEENPFWKGAYRIDVRSKEWQELILNRILPEIFSKGYQGLFFDTIDTAIYLEDKDPIQYKGSKKAMVELIKKIRERFPEAYLLPNNGLEILEQIAPYVNGVLVEDLYTRYNFSKKISEKTPKEETQYKEKFLDTFQIRHQKPIFNIMYEDSPKTPLARYGIKQSNQKGYHWYLSDIHLMTISPFSK